MYSARCQKSCCIQLILADIDQPLFEVMCFLLLEYRIRFQSSSTRFLWEKKHDFYTYVRDELANELADS
jgi:hypothetical protein